MLFIAAVAAVTRQLQQHSLARAQLCRRCRSCRSQLHSSDPEGNSIPRQWLAAPVYSMLREELEASQQTTTHRAATAHHMQHWHQYDSLAKAAVHHHCRLRCHRPSCAYAEAQVHRDKQFVSIKQLYPYFVI